MNSYMQNENPADKIAFMANDPNQKKEEEERGSSSADNSRYTPDAGVNGVEENQVVNDQEQVLPVNPTEQMS